MRFVFISWWFLSGLSLAFGCPACKDALITEGARGLAQGYYWSIILMLGLPFFLTGLVAFLIVRANRVKKLIIEN